MIAAPDASPSKPSVKLTPFELPRTRKITQRITKTIPSFIEVSRTPEKYIEIGASPDSSSNCNPAYAKPAAKSAWPKSFCFAVSPSDCFLEIFNQSSRKPIKPNPTISAITNIAEAVIPTPVSKWLAK